MYTLNNLENSIHDVNLGMVEVNDLVCHTGNFAGKAAAGRPSADAYGFDRTGKNFACSIARDRDCRRG
jgi:hypothetical protein